MSITTTKPGMVERPVDSTERQRLLEENLSEVRYIARRIHDRLPSHVSFEDLAQAGILGLIDAVDKFHPEKNVQLKSYARFRIHGAILDSLRQMDWSPRHLRRQARQIEEANHELSAELGRNPSEPEIATKLGITLEGFQRQLWELRGLDLGSLQSQAEDRGGEETISSVVVQTEEDPFQVAAKSEMRGLLAEAIEVLDEKERRVLGLYYLDELTMKAVGLLLNVGESRISQIHRTALVRLRSWLNVRLGAGSAAGKKTESSSLQTR